MTPTTFPEANSQFGPPPDLTKEQCGSIPAFMGDVKSGSCEGAPLVVTAWKPNAQELADIINGKPIFFTCLGGLPPHFITTDFVSATNPP